MKTTETITLSSECFNFLLEAELFAEIAQLKRSKTADISIRRVAGDTVYIEVRNVGGKKKLNGYQLLEMAYALFIKHLPKGYRLAVEL